MSALRRDSLGTGLDEAGLPLRAAGDRYRLLVQIREKCPADAGDCLDLLMLVHRRDRYPLALAGEEVPAFLSPEHETAAWVAVHEQRVVGHVALHWSADDPTLGAAGAVTGLPVDELILLARLFVAPDVRRLGLGRLLLRHAAAHGRSRGRRPVLDVGQTLAPAIRLYESEGWLRLAELHPPVDESRTLDLWVYASPDTSDGE